MKSVSIATLMVTTAETALTPTDKILEHTIIETQIEEKTVRSQKTSKSPTKTTHNNTLKTEHTKQP